MTISAVSLLSQHDDDLDDDSTRIRRWKLLITLFSFHLSFHTTAAATDTVFVPTPLSLLIFSVGFMWTGSECVLYRAVCVSAVIRHTDRESHADSNRRREEEAKSAKKRSHNPVSLLILTVAYTLNTLAFLLSSTSLSSFSLILNFHSLTHIEVRRVMQHETV